MREPIAERDPELGFLPADLARGNRIRWTA
jgi:hypothetical protein